MAGGAGAAVGLVSFGVGGFIGVAISGMASGSVSGFIPQELLPSVGYKHARYGDGVYLTDLESENLTMYQVSRRLYGIHWNYRKVQYFIKIDVSNLNIIKNTTNNFFIPTNNPIPLNGRIVDGGVTIFKLKLP